MRSRHDSIELSKAEAHFRTMAFRIVYNQVFAHIEISPRASPAPSPTAAARSSIKTSLISGGRGPEAGA